MIRIAIFASGSGSNAENIVNYFRKKNIGVDITLFVTNKPDAYVLKRAENLHIDALVFSKDDFNDGSKILDSLKAKSIDFIVLAGFLLKVPTVLLAAYPNKIINIHPALLPKFGGKGMYGDRVHKAVVEAGETQSGITIHFVNENYDEGAHIFQAVCPVTPQDTYEDVARKVHALEYRFFPEVIEQVVAQL